MNTSDLAIIAMAVVSLASMGRDFKLHMRVADRLRLVNPAKTPVQPPADAGQNATVEELLKRRIG